MKTYGRRCNLDERSACIDLIIVKGKQTFGGTKVERPRRAMKLIVNLRLGISGFSQHSEIQWEVSS